MQEVLKKLQDSNEKQSKQILNLNESVASIYKSVSTIEKTIDKDTKEKKEERKRAEASEKRRIAEAKRKSADNPLKRVMSNTNKEQKKQTGLLSKLLSGGGLLSGLLGSLGAISVPAILGALGLGAIGTAISAYIASPEFRGFVNEHVLNPIGSTIQSGFQSLLNNVNEHVLNPVGSAIFSGVQSLLNNAGNAINNSVAEITNNMGNGLQRINPQRYVSNETKLSREDSTRVKETYAHLTTAFVEDPSKFGSTKKEQEAARELLIKQGEAAIQLDKYTEVLSNLTEQKKREQKDLQELEDEKKKQLKALKDYKAWGKTSDAKKAEDNVKTLQARIDKKLKELENFDTNININDNRVKTLLSSAVGQELIKTLNQDRRLRSSGGRPFVEYRQQGGPVRVPGTGSGDKVPAFLPSGSFVLNRSATNHFFQEGGAIPKVPVMLEPGEMVFPEATPDLEKKNREVRRFGSPRKNNGGANEMMLDPRTQYLQNGGKVFLHWAGTPHNGYASPSYHATIMKDGSPKKTLDYSSNFDIGQHTAGFNSQGVGISLDAMGQFNGRWPDFGDFGPYAVKPEQYKGMAKLTAEILNGWGYGPEYVTKSNVMTHAEAANKGDNKGGYGPLSDPNTIPPGDYRWDLWGLYENSSPGSGGNEIRSMIRSAFTGVPDALTQVGKPITITDYNMDGKIDIQDVNWWTDILKNKPHTGQVAKLGSTDKHKIYDGKGWTDWDVKTKAASITSQSTQTPALITTTPSTPSTQTPQQNNMVQNMMGGLFGFAENIPLIGDFMKGFKRGFNRDLDPDSPAAALQGFIFGGAGQNDTSNTGNNNPFNPFGTSNTGNNNPFGTSSSTPITGSVSEKLSQMANLAKDAGFTNEQAKIMAAIAGGESTFNPNAHNTKGRDNSYGLWQINMLGKMGEERRKAFGLQSNEELFDPKVNAKAAKQIFDSQGFEAWGAYTDGNAAKYMKEAQKIKLQQGGWIGAPNALLEPGEGVWTPEMMNEAVPRFQSGGAVNMRGKGTSNDWIDSSMNQSAQQPIIIVNNPPPQGGGMVSADPGGGTPDIPAMSSGPTSPLAGLLMTQTYLLADRIG